MNELVFVGFSFFLHLSPFLCTSSHILFSPRLVPLSYFALSPLALSPLALSPLALSPLALSPLSLSPCPPVLFPTTNPSLTDC